MRPSRSVFSRLFSRAFPHPPTLLLFSSFLFFPFFRPNCCCCCCSAAAKKISNIRCFHLRLLLKNAFLLGHDIDAMMIDQCDSGDDHPTVARYDSRFPPSSSGFSTVFSLVFLASSVLVSIIPRVRARARVSLLCEDDDDDDRFEPKRLSFYVGK